MNYPSFSVLMSLYIKEKVEYFDECMKSLLNQTVLPSEIVIVFDGPLTDEMYSKVKDYENAYPGLIKIINNSYNKGLGLALADGIPECSYDLIARMDTDDIARIDRFEIQLERFRNNPELDICGSHIIEFEGCINNVLGKRTVPLTNNDIIKYQKRRSAFNHMTVMYKKSAVIKAGNYEDCPLMEDDLLWSKMIMTGAHCENIDDYLVFARTGRAMIERRGGIKYFLKYKNGKTKMKEMGFINSVDYYITVIPQFIISTIPSKLRLLLFRLLLRER